MDHNFTAESISPMFTNAELEAEITQYNASLVTDGEPSSYNEQQDAYFENEEAAIEHWVKHYRNGGPSVLENLQRRIESIDIGIWLVKFTKHAITVYTTTPENDDFIQRRIPIPATWEVVASSLWITPAEFYVMYPNTLPVD